MNWYALCERFGVTPLINYLRQLMNARNKQSKLPCYLSSIFMMLALAWLTISLPFVYSAQQGTETQQTAKNSLPDSTEEDANPFANTTEEKTPNSVNAPSEEYLHDNDYSENYISVPSTEYKIVHTSLYIAFHGELISPPPDAA
jgi:hypothetical protein